MTTRTVPVARPRAFTSKDLALIASFAALTAVLSLMPALAIGTPVPVTLQTLGVMLAGSLLGARRAGAAMALYVVLGLAGLPVFSGGSAGLGILTGPSGGYLLGFIAGAAVIGAITARAFPRYTVLRGTVACLVGGIGVVYLIGIPWQAVNLGSGLGATIVASLEYLPGDIVKLVVCVIVSSAVVRGYPPLVAGARNRTAR